MTDQPAGLYVLGFGGHARSVGDIALAAGVARLVFVDANARPAESFAGFEVVTALPAEPLAGWQAFPAAGDNNRRQAQVTGSTLPVATLVAPSAHIGAGASIGAGTFIGAGAHIGPLATIGEGVIVNTGAIVEHEAHVGAFSHVSIGAAVAGRSRIGSRVMVGAGAVVIDGITVCDDVTIGAGATVVADITAPGVYLGTPAKRMRLGGDVPAMAAMPVADMPAEAAPLRPAEAEPVQSDRTAGLAAASDEARGLWLTVVLASLAAVLGVLLIRWPFSAPLLGSIEEWGLLGRFMTDGPIFTTGPWSNMRHLSLRPLNLLTFGLSYVIDPGSFFGWNLIFNASLVLKAASMAGIVWWLTRDRWLSVAGGLMLMMFPADMMQMSLRSVHINTALAVTLLACFLCLLATECRSAGTMVATSLAAGLLLLAGCMTYEAGLFISPLPALLWWARYGVVDGWKRLGRGWIVPLVWAVAIAIEVAYLLIVGRSPGIYQQSISSDPGSTLALLASRLPLLFTVGGYRIFGHAWYDAARMLAELRHLWPLAALLAAAVAGSGWLALRRHVSTGRPAVFLRLAVAAPVIALLGYLPYLSSYSHILITQRTHIYSAVGGALCLVACTALLMRWRRTAAVGFATLAIVLGTASQWTQYDHYTALSARMRMILSGVAEAAPHLAPGQKLLIIDRAGDTSNTWMLRGELLDAALTYLHGRPVDVSVCAEPGLIYSSFHVDARGRRGRCVEQDDKWVVGEGLPQPLVLQKQGLITLAIEPEGAVRRIGQNAPETPSAAQIARWRGILQCWPAAACTYVRAARQDGSYMFDFGRWWSLEEAPWGGGWRDAEWNPPRLMPRSFAWMTAPESRLWFMLQPASGGYLVRVTVANWISVPAKTEMRIVLNGVQLAPVWQSEFVVEARAPEGAIRAGLNNLVLAAPLDETHGISLAVDRVELLPVR